MQKMTTRIKVVFLGETGVGKSSLMHKLIKPEEFLRDPAPTIGASYVVHTIPPDNTTNSSSISAELWDAAGQSRFRTMAPMYYRGANLIYVTMDWTADGNFSKVKSWL